MPHRPRSICRQPGCNRKASDRFCDEHRQAYGGFGKRPTHPFYNSRIWKHPRTGLRARQLRAEPTCRECRAAGRYEPAAVADHVKRWQSGSTETEMWELFTDPDNLQSLCTHHHNVKSAKERHE
jgi:5-methylcytosine-specific restriction enzyme A